MPLFNQSTDNQCGMGGYVCKNRAETMPSSCLHADISFNPATSRYNHISFVNHWFSRFFHFA